MNIVGYLKDTKVELKNVTWPSRRQATVFTVVVIGLSAAVALYLGALDVIFNFLLRFIFQ